MNQSRKNVTEKEKVLYSMWKSEQIFRNRLNRFQVTNDEGIISNEVDAEEDAEVVFVSSTETLKRPLQAQLKSLPGNLLRPVKCAKFTIKPVIRPRQKSDKSPNFDDFNCTDKNFFFDKCYMQKQIDPQMVAHCSDSSQPTIAPLAERCPPVTDAPTQRLFFPLPPSCKSFERPSLKDAYLTTLPNFSELNRQVEECGELSQRRKKSVTLDNIFKDKQTNKRINTKPNVSTARIVNNNNINIHNTNEIVTRNCDVRNLDDNYNDTAKNFKNKGGKKREIAEADKSQLVFKNLLSKVCSETSSTHLQVSVDTPKSSINTLAACSNMHLLESLAKLDRVNTELVADEIVARRPLTRAQAKEAKISTSKNNITHSSVVDDLHSPTDSQLENAHIRKLSNLVKSAEALLNSKDVKCKKKKVPLSGKNAKHRLRMARKQHIDKNEDSNVNTTHYTECPNDVEWHIEESQTASTNNNKMENNKNISNNRSNKLDVKVVSNRIAKQKSKKAKKLLFIDKVKVEETTVDESDLKFAPIFEYDGTLGLDDKEIIRQYEHKLASSTKQLKHNDDDELPNRPANNLSSNIDPNYTRTDSKAVYADLVCDNLASEPFSDITTRVSSSYLTADIDESSVSETKATPKITDNQLFSPRNLRNSSTLCASTIMTPTKNNSRHSSVNDSPLPDIKKQIKEELDDGNKSQETASATATSTNLKTQEESEKMTPEETNYLKKCWIFVKEELKVEADLHKLDSQISTIKEELLVLTKQRSELQIKREEIRAEKVKLHDNAPHKFREL